MGFLVVLVASGEGYPTVFGTERWQTLVDLFVDVRSVGYATANVFL